MKRNKTLKKNTMKEIFDQLKSSLVLMSNKVPSIVFLVRLFEIDIFVIDCYSRNSMKLFP